MARFKKARAESSGGKDSFGGHRVSPVDAISQQNLRHWVKGEGGETRFKTRT